MLRIDFELLREPAKGDISDFARGNIVVTGATGIASSKGQTPDQSAMLFLSAVEMLDGLRRFLLDPGTSQFTYVAVDSSFQFTVAKVPGDHVALSADGLPMYTVPTEELVREVDRATSDFWNRTRARLDPGGAVIEDLNCALLQFRAALLGADL